MKTIRNLLILAILLVTVQISTAAVPSTINYQGRLTNTAGVPQPGTHSMSLKIYDAATTGTQLYAETIGNVTVDANGVYGFQFGSAGLSDTLVTETIAITDGSTLTYQKALSNTPVLPSTVSVTDGTYSWNEIDGNPGSPATATAEVISGFVIGASVTYGGTGYTSAPTVTITGNGTGATATGTVSGGTVSGITITNAGSGYNTGATITLAQPPASFVVNYSGGTISSTYVSAPAAGQTITATYRYSATGISAALAVGSEQWLELTVDGVVQNPRQKMLVVPFAIIAQSANTAKAILAQEKIWRPQTFLGFQSTVIEGKNPFHWKLPIKVTSFESYYGEAAIPATFITISKIDCDYNIPYYSLDNSVGIISFKIMRYKGDLQELLSIYEKTAASNYSGRHQVSLPQNIIMDPSWIYKLHLNVRYSGATSLTVKVYDLTLTVTE